MARVVLGESRLKARKRKRHVLVGGGVCFVIAAVCGSSVWLAHASFVRITGVVVSGAAGVLPDIIKSAVEKDIAGAYLWVYPKNNIVLYPKSTIHNHLLTQFPTLKSADVHLNPPIGGLHTLYVTVVERKPTALWCGFEASSSNCFLLDENGLVYAPAPHYSGDAYIKYAGTEFSGGLPWHYLTGQEFHSLSALVEAIVKLARGAYASGGRESADRVVTVSVDTSNDVHIHFAGGFELLFGLHDDSGQLFERFSLALSAAPFTTHALGEFEYLDLRFGDKLYYKLKGQ